MSVVFDDLKPYKTLMLGQVDDEEIIVEPVITVFKELLDFAGNPDLGIVTEGPTTIFETEHPDLAEPVQIHVKFLHYTEERAPGWYGGGGEVRDTLNHLIVACQQNRQVAIYLSDSRKRSAAARQIKAGNGVGLGALKLLDPDLLNAAFVREKTRTIWLSGLHAPVEVKADSKILSGLDLQHALDPLGDQTYYFTAARSSMKAFKQPIGVSPRGSRIWAGTTSRWLDFVESVSGFLHYLEITTARVTNPLPVLAIPSIKAPDLAEAYEIHFLPPELLAEEVDIEAETKEMMERWAYRSDLVVKKGHGNNLEAVVNMDGVKLGTLSLVFDTSEPANVLVESSEVEPDPECPEEYGKYLDELETISLNTRWIKVWYESGHTLTNGAIFEIRHRDQPFEQFRWADFKGYEVKMEKFWSGSFPENALELIGTRKSLFCWVKNNWPLQNIPNCPYSATPVWLACDDGAGEISDFIHLDIGGETPVLTLIHVKGAKSKETTRGISVSSYEVVVGQAVKNARFLDRVHMGEGLKAGLKTKIGKLVWFDGEPRTRDEMLEALDKIGMSYKRVVVVLQPHVRKSRLQQVRKAIEDDKSHQDKGRLRQLDTLLLGAQASCRAVGAELWVVADET